MGGESEAIEKPDFVTEAEFKQRPDMDVLFSRGTGDPLANESLDNKLCGILLYLQHIGINVKSAPFARFLEDRDNVSLAGVRWEVCVPIGGSFSPASSDIGSMSIPGTQVVSTVVTADMDSEVTSARIAKSQKYLEAYAEKKGCRAGFPLIEIYLVDGNIELQLQVNGEPTS